MAVIDLWLVINSGFMKGVQSGVGVSGDNGLPLRLHIRQRPCV